jgi:dienelactone hydrolase
MKRFTFAAIALFVVTSAIRAEPATYPAVDSLRLDGPADPIAERTLEALRWSPGPFTVEVIEPAGAPIDCDAIVRFPSPRPAGDPSATWNTVVMEWYKPKLNGVPGTAAPGKRPTVLALHILDGRMTIARAIARTLAAQGIGSFVMHMPGYGQRQSAEPWYDVTRFFPRVQQAAADARRARDAIAALPGVDPDRISIQGTSLGSFIASLAAGLDGAFDQTFLMLSGAEMYNMFHHGQRETAWIRQRLLAAGIDDDALRRMCDQMDPGNLAPRLDPQRTWLFSAKNDQVVPAANAAALAKAARLTGDHHRWLGGDHYTCILYLPWTVQTMATTIRQVESR